MTGPGGLLPFLWDMVRSRIYWVGVLWLFMAGAALVALRVYGDVNHASD
ncbi:MAG TPA: hypothetical protein VFM74_04600 [Candidatus Limnocylindria bacterium]|nr:hypothetical protein [Candidatus Limnocylindria bacterium]